MRPVKQELRMNQKEKLTGSSQEKKMTLFKRIVWILTAILSFVWIFIPEFTDLIPFWGWLDEGAALMLFLTALAELGINVPVIAPLLRFFSSKRSFRK